MESPSYQLIDTEPGWRECLEVLRRQPRLAVDLEANSLFAYQEQVCLLQVSTPEHDFIIDPLADFSLDGLGEIFTNPKVEKIFHASSYDLMLIKYHYGWTLANLFDTMWAGRILGFRNMGLAWFLQDFYGVQVSKRFQKANWAQRPLSSEMLEYARNDTHYLLRLRDELAARLDEQGCLEEAREIFANECQVPMPDRAFRPDAFWSVSGARELRPRAQAILKALYLFRDKEARERNWPPFKVLSEERLVVLARHAPKTEHELEALHCLSKNQFDRLGRELLKVIAEARLMRPPAPPKHPRHHGADAARLYKTLFEWRRDTATKRGVESDVVMTRETMWQIAEAHPRALEEFDTVTTLGPYRRALYAEEILELLSE